MMSHSTTSLVSPCCCGVARSRHAHATLGRHADLSVTVAVRSASGCKHKQRGRSTKLKRDYGRHLWSESPLRPAACWPGGGGIHLKGNLYSWMAQSEGTCARNWWPISQNLLENHLSWRDAAPHPKPGRWKVMNIEVTPPDTQQLSRHFGLFVGSDEAPPSLQCCTVHTYIALSLVPNELYRIGPAWLVSLTGTHISICSTWAGREDRLGGGGAFSVTSESFAATASSDGKSARLHLHCPRTRAIISHEKC